MDSVDIEVQHAKKNMHKDDEKEPEIVCCGLFGAGEEDSDDGDSPEAKKAK